MVRGVFSMRIVAACVATVVMVWVGVSVHAEVIVFGDRAEWEAAVGPVTTLDFTGFPDGTFITDQYSELGATFTDGDDSIRFNPTFKNDSWGLDGNGDISVTFDTPQLWVAVDFPGYIAFRLFFQGEMIHQSVHGSGGNGWFIGLVSDEPFDALVLIDPLAGGEAAIDDLHYGVPAPATLVLLGLAALAPRRRRLRPAM
jgi:hypothetical protein